METSLEQLVEQIQQERKKIDETRIYYILRKRGLRYIREETIDTVAWCIALKKVSLPVTTNLLSYFKGRRMMSCLVTLHTLGDKGVLNLSPQGTNPFHSWEIDEDFYNEYVSREGSE